ncbi:hypothetical protein [Pseudomonas sp. CFBP 13602]|uniref:hypothetical protein n=1 Tax=Pseudomonas sp. CFBP 13602 TaxID=2774039 RepID=UPI00177A80E4|nr:hypothetical protein [Pseudomonas sp. CFBP 13602]MBD8828680.1 hypothetical protein [Pseudomonas sp. CFBP 13602]
MRTPPAGAAIGREMDAAVDLPDRDAPFAAMDRSYGGVEARVGAVIGREMGAAVDLLDRGAPFAAMDRSYGVSRHA